jgi:hypothetical protein
MSDWIHNLPVPLMALAIFAFTYLPAIIIFAAVSTLAKGERAKSFQAISPDMLPVLGIIFGLFVAFTAAQVWNDNDLASAAVSREASALRAVMLLAAGLPSEQAGRLHDLIRGYIEHTAKVEWPMMARQKAGRGPADCAARNNWRTGVRAGCAQATDHRKRSRSQFGQMVEPVLAGDMRVARDRIRSLWQPAGIGDCDGAFRDRSGGLGTANRCS